MKFVNDILGRLLYVIIGALVFLFISFLSAPKHSLSPPIQSRHVAEILATGARRDPSILASPESLDAFIRKQKDLDQRYFVSGNLLLAVIREVDAGKSLFLLSPQNGFATTINPNGKAQLISLIRRSAEQGAAANP